MNCWLITVGEPLPVVDPGNPRLLRTGVLARRLHERGHGVVWWTASFDHFSKTMRTPTNASIDWGGVEIRMLSGCGYQRNVSWQRMREHAQVARHFRTEAPLRDRPDVILASLPTVELAREAVRYGRRAGVPVLLDIRDLWPDLLIEHAPPRLRWLSRWLLRGMVAGAHEAMEGADGLIGISDAYLDWALRYARRERRGQDALIPLGYVAPPPLADDASTGQRMRSLGVDPSATLCWYVGTFGLQYDLEPVIDAARRCQAAARADTQFVITGDGELGERWRSLAADLTNVVFTGWVGADEINWMRSRAAIGLQPYVDGAPQGLANKLFEYLSAGIPVVSSLRGENERLIAQHACGLTYRAGDGADCWHQLETLLNDPQRRRTMGESGRRLFQTSFDGNAVFEKLADHLEAIAQRGPSSV